MIRGTWVWDAASRCMVPKDEWLSRRPDPARSSLPSPMFVRDCIEMQSMVDGKVYTSKAAYRKHLRQKGYIEVGNEYLRNEPKTPEPKIDRKAIRNAVGKSLNRVGIIVAG